MRFFECEYIEGKETISSLQIIKKDSDRASWIKRVHIQGRKDNPLSTVWYFQQMSLFTELKACVHQSGLPQSEHPCYSLSNHLYAWFSFIPVKKKTSAADKLSSLELSAVQALLCRLWYLRADNIHLQCRSAARAREGKMLCTQKGTFF